MYVQLQVKTHKQTLKTRSICYTKKCKYIRWLGVKFGAASKDEEKLFLSIFRFGLMTFIMQSQMIATSETSLTNGTLEGFVTGVFSHMASQFVGPSEPPLALQPGAFVWFIACNKSQPLISIAQFVILLSSYQYGLAHEPLSGTIWYKLWCSLQAKQQQH